jgi:hypothetical protein
MLAPRLPPLIATSTLRIMKVSAREAVFGCRLWRDRRLPCSSTRLSFLAILLRRLCQALPHLLVHLRALLPLILPRLLLRLHQALPHLFAHLRALLPFILVRLQPFQLALF